MYRRSISWVDVGGRERMTILTSVTGAPDAYTDLSGLSNAAVSTWHEGEWLPTYAGTVPVAEYASVHTVQVLSVEDATNHRSHVLIPAPASSLLLADRINSDGTTTEWITLEAALSTLIIPFSALPVVTLLASTAMNQAQSAYENYTNYNTGITWGRRANQWRDTLGNGYIQYLTGAVESLTDSTTLEELSALMQAVSTAIITDTWQGEMTVPEIVTPTNYQYNSVNDYAKLVFQDDNGNKTNVIVPAPVRTIFLPDGKTIDPDNIFVANLIADAIDELAVPTSGAPVTGYVGGVLVKSRRRV